MAERFHIHTEEVEPAVFELSLEHQEGDRRLLGTRWRTAAVLALSGSAAPTNSATKERRRGRNKVC